MPPDWQPIIRIALPGQARAGEVISIRTVITHPMETGLRLDAFNDYVPQRCRSSHAEMLRSEGAAFVAPMDNITPTNAGSGLVGSGGNLMARQKPLTDATTETGPDPDRDATTAVAELFSGQKSGAEITLRRLRIFWAVAHSSTLTRAAKLLNVSQPTLSQQLTGFEAAIGAALFDRRSNRMVLTETGEMLLRKAEQVLRSAQELEDSLPTTGQPARQTLRIAGVASVMRVILPAAMQDLATTAPGIDYDIHESAPAEIIDLLYARRVNIGLMAANSVAEVSAGFQQIPIMADPFVLAVPERIDLSRVTDLQRDLAAADLQVLNNTIQFVFGTQHSSRIQSWFDATFPKNHLSVRVRSFELALDLVASGAGICVVPALTALVGDHARKGVRLYAIDLEPRRIVAMVPSQYLRVAPYAAFLAALQAAGQSTAMPDVAPMPPFIATAPHDR